MIKKIKLNELVGKIVCKSEHPSIKDKHGKYPRISWTHESGTIIHKKHIIYQYVKIPESPHYQFVLGNKDPYIEYMKIDGWISGYSKERIEAHINFQNLINTFDGYNPNIKYIEVVEERGHYAIIDGLHRASILYSRDPEQEVLVKIIKCRNYTNLPIKKL